MIEFKNYRFWALITGAASGMGRIYAERLAEYGYNEVNINLGCPSGTVVSKKRGAGLLAYPDELDYFLDKLFQLLSLFLQQFSLLLEVYIYL